MVSCTYDVMACTWTLMIEPTESESKAELDRLKECKSLCSLEEMIFL